MQSTSQTPEPGIHVAIIMDGNGRWARGRSLPRAAGHHAGVDAIRRVVLPSAVPLTIGDWTVPLWADALITIGFGAAMLTLAVHLFAKTE